MRYAVRIASFTVACLALVAGIPAGSLSTVSAMSCGTNTIYFRGATRTSTNHVTGAQAHMTALPRYTCANGDNISSWTMVQNLTSEELQYTSICNPAFIVPVQEINAPGHGPTVSGTEAQTKGFGFFGPTITFGNTYNFKVARNFTKDQARYSGEAHWSASYIPGYSSRRVYFDRLRWRTTEWYSPWDSR